MNPTDFSSVLRRLAWLPLLALLCLAGAAARAQAQADPPGRVAYLSHRDGSVVYAPDGEDEWLDLPANRPLTRGDRLWTDRGARAELQLGSATLHLASESNVAFFELDDGAAQISLTQGSLNARVRELAARENFEIDTPNLAVRVARPGDVRVDVDAARGLTRVAVRSGEVVVYGERGESQRLFAGQQAAFAGRDLDRVRDAFGADDFDAWTAERNRREDESISARYVPREVIGYSQLDSWGTWGQDPGYGAVWYPRVAVQNWAPYRYGHWAYIRPWGWTWVDDAPWGFAPFHYGRWALIHGRWAWVPGRFGPRPVYSPALVVFVGGGSGVSFSFSIGSSPGIAWYPLAPGEAWFPTYRYSPVYLSRINYNITIVNRPDRDRDHVHRRRTEAVTAVRVDDFNRGRPVREAWQPVRPEDIQRASVVRELPRPEREREERDRRERPPRLQAQPPQPAPAAQQAGRVVREPRGRDAAREEREQDKTQREQERAQREQERAQREQDGARDQAARQQQERAQREAERAAREQDRAQREQDKAQREQAVRQQQERVQREQERNQREAERAQREQERAQREQAVRQQQERAQREQERAQREAERAQREQERAQREQAVRQQQERAQREQERAQREAERAQREQERAQREQQRPQPIRAVPQVQKEEREPRGKGADRDRDDDNRGRGRGG